MSGVKRWQTDCRTGPLFGSIPNLSSPQMRTFQSQSENKVEYLVKIFFIDVTLTEAAGKY